MTLADVSTSLKGCRLEDVVPAQERLSIQQRCYPESKASKDLYNRALQELLQRGEANVFDPMTAEKFKEVIEKALDTLKK